MPFPVRLRGAAQGHALKDRAVVADRRRLADHDALAVIEEDPLPDLRRRVQLRAEDLRRDAREQAGVVFAPAQLVNTTGRSIGILLAAGFLVGFGTRLGNGCTSGHGVCGISRFSPRSLVATLSFIATGVLAVWLFRAVGS